LRRRLRRGAAVDRQAPGRARPRGRAAARGRDARPRRDRGAACRGRARVGERRGGRRAAGALDAAAPGQPVGRPPARAGVYEAGVPCVAVEDALAVAAGSAGASPPPSLSSPAALISAFLAVIAARASRMRWAAAPRSELIESEPASHIVKAALP